MLHANQSATSAIHHQRVLFLLRRMGTLSRAEIARYTGLTKATVSKIIASLQGGGLIHEVGKGQHKRGRPSTLYEFNTSSGISVGVEIRGDELQGVVTRLDAHPLRNYSRPLLDHSPESVIELVAQIIDEVLQDFNEPLAGVGIGLPGVCDKQQKTVILSERLHWKDLPLAQMIEDRLANLGEVLVCVENRANAAALAERWYGVGCDVDNFVYIHIGAGIKAGIILNGEVYTGVNGGAGEIGHSTLDVDGPLCVCGKRGCLEAYASTNAILERAIAQVKAGKGDSLVQRFGPSAENLTIQQLLTAAQDNDPTVMRILEEAARYFGLAVSTVVNFYNPQLVILGPFVTRVPGIFLDVVRNVVNEHVFEIPLRGLSGIVTTSLSQQAVAIGAAALPLAKELQLLEADLNLGPLD
jgi:N-acetylglucosamine repressor